MKNLKSIFGFVTLVISIALVSCKTDVPNPVKSAEELLLEEAVKSISIPNEIDDKTEKITLPKKLDDERFSAITITWVSDKPDVIDSEGTVSHKLKDEDVKLTATVSIKDVKVTKEFVTKVKNVSTPEVRLILEAFNVVKIPAEIDVNTDKVSMPAKLEDPKFASLKLTWATNRPTIIDLSGTVHHADKTESDAVKLTLTIANGKFSRNKTYTVTVKNEITQEKLLLDEAIETVSIPTIVDEETVSIDMFAKLKDEKYKDIQVSWISSKPDIISQAGAVVHKDIDEAENVTITAVLKLNDKVATKVFDVTVKNRKFSGDQTTLVNAVKNYNLNISSLDKTATTISLPSVLPDNKDITIEWSSNNSSIIDTATMKVTPPDSMKHATVTLTGTFSYHNAKTSKDFNIEVAASPSDKTSVDEAVKYLIESVIPVIEENQNYLVLFQEEALRNRFSGYMENVTIEWKSSDTSIISKGSNTDWDVKHTPKAGNQKVTITLTVKAGSEKRTEQVSVTVENPAKTQDEINTEIINQIKTELDIPTVVKEYENSIELPNSTPSHTYIMITWTSSNQAVISNDGKVTHTDGNAADTVTLTASMKSGNITGTKEFTVTVNHPQTGLQPADVLDIAVKELKLPNISDPNNVKETIVLPTTKDIDKYTVNIIWELLTNDRHFSLTDNKLVLKRDFAEIAGSIKANISYNSQTVSKEFNITLPAITKVIYNDSLGYYMSFENNILEVRNEGSLASRRYTVSNLDISKGTAEFQLTDYAENNDPWINVASDRQRMIGILRKVQDFIPTIENDCSIDNLILYLTDFYNFYGEVMEVTEDFIYEYLVGTECFGPNITDVATAKTLPAEQKAAAYKKAYNSINEEYAMVAKLPAKTPIRDSLAEIITYLSSDTEPKGIFTYDVSENDNVSIIFNSVYDPSKKWYEQITDYRSYEPWVILTPYTRYFYIDSKENCITFSPDGTSFSAREVYTPEQAVSNWKVLEVTPTLIKIQDANDSTRTFTLNFESKVMFNMNVSYKD